VLAPHRTCKFGRAHNEPGDEAVHKGDGGECAYLILDGEVEVLREVNGRWHQLGRLKSGECFGEIALLTDAPRMATVRCLTPMDLVVLPRDQFMILAEGYRALGTALKTRMTERILQAERLGASKETEVA